MDGLTVVSARQQVALAVVVTAEHEEHVRVAADQILKEPLAIAPANCVAPVRLGALIPLRSRAARRVEIVVGHDDGIVPWMAPQHACRPPKHRVAWPV